MLYDFQFRPVVSRFLQNTREAPPLVMVATTISSSPSPSTSPAPSVLMFPVVAGVFTVIELPPGPPSPRGSPGVRDENAISRARLLRVRGSGLIPPVEGGPANMDENAAAGPSGENAQPR